MARDPGAPPFHFASTTPVSAGAGPCRRVPEEYVQLSDSIDNRNRVWSGVPQRSCTSPEFDTTETSATGPSKFRDVYLRRGH